MGYKQLPKRSNNSHKGTFGKVINFAGSYNYPGAAFLSSISALKIGCGLVTLAADKNVIAAVSSLTPDIIYSSPQNGIKNLNKYNAVAIGCGLGTALQSRYLLFKVIEKAAKFDIPLLIDASGLNMLSAKKSVMLNKNTVITPHPAEAGRLLGVETADIEADRINAVKNLAQKYNCVTVLKGHNTLVCSPGCNEVYTNETGSSALAKGGTGDVLCGIIIGLIAQGMVPLDAAKTGVYIHGLCGELASKKLTEYSVLASDLSSFIPEAIKLSC